MSILYGGILGYSSRNPIKNQYSGGYIGGFWRFPNPLHPKHAPENFFKNITIWQNGAYFGNPTFRSGPWISHCSTKAYSQNLFCVLSLYQGCFSTAVAVPGPGSGGCVQEEPLHGLDHVTIVLTYSRRGRKPTSSRRLRPVLGSLIGTS